MRIALLTFFVVFVAGPASATDGVLEINQACVTQTGCFSGDAAGFPATISAPGSYRLTGDLQSPGDAIEITGNHVTLDLNGHVIEGPSGFEDGVSVQGDNVELRNGTVRFFGLSGIKVTGNRSRLIDLRVSDNAVGLNLESSTGHLVDRCTVRNNTILVSSGASLLILNSTADDLSTSGSNNTVTAGSNVFDSASINGTSTLVEIGMNQCGTNTTCP